MQQKRFNIILNNHNKVKRVINKKLYIHLTFKIYIYFQINFFIFYY